MKTSLTSAVVRFALVVGLSLALSLTTSAADVAGTYKCEGDTLTGGKYTGTVTIVKNDEIYRVTWTLGDGKDTYSGLGVLQGDVLAVSYYGSKLGVVAYKVEDDSKLVGKRAMVKGDKVLTEILTKQ